MTDSKLSEMSDALTPPLSGIAQARFVSVGLELRETGDSVNDAIIRQVIDRETKWAQSPAGKRELRGEVAAYRASLRALLDLVRIGWRVEVDRGTLALLPPPKLCVRMNPDEVKARKEDIRRCLWPLVAEQLGQPEFRKFVRRLEQPTIKNNTKSILSLIADNRELASRLEKAKKTSGDKRAALAAKAVKPYLQLVTEGTRDQYTNLLVSEIWRYFRATWSIPNLCVPGRSMLYLVRDAAHSHHAVMGLIALNNAPMRKRSTDEWVGWTPAKLRFEAEQKRQQSNASAQLRGLYDDCVEILKAAVAAICPDGLVTAKELAMPNAQVARRLLSAGDQFDKLRAKALRDLERQNKDNVARRDRKAHVGLATMDLPPLDDTLPDMDATPDPGSRLARRFLVAKKRAYDLSFLLEALTVFNERRAELISPKHALEAWGHEDIATALSTVCSSMKSARLSSNLLEITTCGAIAPYNEILGGKLVALMCFSPELGADYQARYGGSPAIIRSHMANKPVPADCRLAALVTTSLYSAGSSQYERVRLPAGIISPEQPELRIQNIGTSSGFGTVQFSTETANEIDDFARSQRDFVDVNSVFGEGPSPKLRKLRAGLDLLGFSSDDLLKHHQMRLVYSLEYWPGARDFLRFAKGPIPAWVAEPHRFRDASQRIANFWSRRWLSMRLDHAETWSRLESEDGQWKLSDILPVARATIKSSPEPIEPIPLTPLPAPTGRCVYERLAERRSDLYSERLSSDDLDRLHVTTALDNFIISEIEAGRSLVLTGNAGDGKTHILRRLRPQIPSEVAIIEDATAEMTNGEPGPVLTKIQPALNGNRRGRFVLCANEHQLLRLREAAIESGSGKLVDVFRSIDSQCRQRLAYGQPNPAAENAQNGVVVVDLSLRNPLSAGFAGPLLEKLLGDHEVLARAASDPKVERNHRRLSNTQVKSRLLALFDRIALRGERATVRQLWMILARAVFPPESGSAGDAPSSWYSEQIFDEKGKLEIDRLLARYADPAAHSHPRWDWELSEKPDSFHAEDWPVDGKPVGVNYARDTRHWFNPVKRRFYFEHRAGQEVFSLESRADRDFRSLLREGNAPDVAQLGLLLRGLNRLYCPPGFAGDDVELHLWQGLRYHEQPSRAYLAATSLARDKFKLERPRVPARVAAAFNGENPLYLPDHLMLVADCGAGTQQKLLKLDYALYATLLKVAEGLPRHLVPEAHIHRVDAFIERIGAKVNRSGTDFMVFNAEDGTVAKITTNSTRRRVENAILL